MFEFKKDGLLRGSTIDLNVVGDENILTKRKG